MSEDPWTGYNDPLYGVCATEKGSTHSVDLFCHTCFVNCDEKRLVVPAASIYSLTDNDARYNFGSNAEDARNRALVSCWVHVGSTTSLPLSALRLAKTSDVNPNHGLYYFVMCGGSCGERLGSYYPLKLGFYDPPSVRLKLTVRRKMSEQLLLSMCWSTTAHGAEEVTADDFAQRHKLFDHALAGPMKRCVEELQAQILRHTATDLSREDLLALVALERERVKLERAPGLGDNYSRMKAVLRTYNSLNDAVAVQQPFTAFKETFVMLTTDIARKIAVARLAKEYLRYCGVEQRAEASHLLLQCHDRSLLNATGYGEIICHFRDSNDDCREWYRRAQSVLVLAEERDAVYEALCNALKVSPMDDLMTIWNASVWRAVFKNASAAFQVGHMRSHRSIMLEQKESIASRLLEHIDMALHDAMTHRKVFCNERNRTLFPNVTARLLAIDSVTEVALCDDWEVQAFHAIAKAKVLQSTFAVSVDKHLARLRALLNASVLDMCKVQVGSFSLLALGTVRGMDSAYTDMEKLYDLRIYPDVWKPRAISNDRVVIDFHVIGDVAFDSRALMLFATRRAILSLVTLRRGDERSNNLPDWSIVCGAGKHRRPGKTVGVSDVVRSVLERIVDKTGNNCVRKCKSGTFWLRSDSFWIRQYMKVNWKHLICTVWDTLSRGVNYGRSQQQYPPVISH